MNVVGRAEIIERIQSRIAMNQMLCGFPACTTS